MSRLTVARSWVGQQWNWIGQQRNWIRERRNPRRRDAVRSAQHHLRLPRTLSRSRKQRGSVWAVSIVKNEIDVVEWSIRHQLEQGIDAVLIADNGSTDGTVDVLMDLARDLPIHVAVDEWPAWDQAVKTTLLAGEARRAGADWVIPFDADEFWFALGVSVAEHLRRSTATVEVAQMHNLFPLADGAEASWPKTVYRLDSTPSSYEKVAFRSHRTLSVSAGNHDVYRWGRRQTGLRIAHLPWRSFEQMERKAAQGAAATAAAGLPSGVNKHWAALAALPREDQLQRWQQILAGQPADGAEWSPVGPFIEVSPLTWPTWDPDGLIARHEGRHDNRGERQQRSSPSGTPSQNVSPTREAPETTP